MLFSMKSFFTDLHLKQLTSDLSLVDLYQQELASKSTEELLSLRDAALEFAKLCEEQV